MLAKQPNFKGSVKKLDNRVLPITKPISFIARDMCVMWLSPGITTLFAFIFQLLAFGLYSNI